jgi:hypothetical protein
MNPSVIRQWFAEQPSANLGIVGGHGLVIVDLDRGKQGLENFAHLVAEHAGGERLPRTAIAASGSTPRGLHIYFRLPPGVEVRNTTGLREGIDIRGCGGQVVAPPSVHPDSGECYIWCPDVRTGIELHPRCGIALIPDWLLALLPVQKPRSSSIDGARMKASRPQSKKALRSPAGRSASRQGKSIVQGRDDGATGTPGPLHGTPAGSDQIETLVADMIERFPVRAVGSRHHAMTAAVGSLVGRMFDTPTITCVMMRWYDHFKTQGTIGSERDEMERELAACLNGTHNNPSFRVGTCQSDFESECARVVLPPELLDLLGRPVTELAALLKSDHDDRDRDGERTPGTEEGPGNEDPCYQGEEDSIQNLNNTLYRGHTNQRSVLRVTRELDPSESPSNTNKRSLMGTLCDTRDERWFVEALLAMLVCQHRRRTETAPPQSPWRFEMTHDQLRRVVSLRYDEAEHPVWTNTQIDRLKDKYFDRIRADEQRKPATRFELFTEIVKGRPARGSAKATPSAYEPTGVRVLLRAGGDGLRLDPLFLRLSPKLGSARFSIP